MGKIDPLAGKYYWVSTLEKVISFSFLIGCALSFLILFKNDMQFFKVNTEIFQFFFILITLIIFILGNYIRLGAFPDAEEARLKDFFGRSFNAGISSEATQEYYNDSETNPFRKLASQLLENLLFTKSISREMLPYVRSFTLAYLILWFGILLWRQVPLDWIAVAAQALFSEEILAKWLKLEWLHHRCKNLYDQVYVTIKTQTNKAVFKASILAQTSVYERIKATAATTLCQKTFKKLNPKLSLKWVEIQNEVGLAP